ncbi:MAG TPA: DUF1565 domain-containing protein [Candidatus Binatia bacterium]|nr:DUF1565 domain-containing protein [Candidatus Binatia bacterium]
MYRVWLSRLFLTAVAASALAGIVGGTACTRWGQPGPITPTLAPLVSIYVSANTGSDTSGNGSVTNPYKSLTKAVAVLVAAKSISPNGVTINLATGDYDAANGEKFPIVVPRSVSISGTNYGAGVKGGSFIDGFGEDTIFERIVHTARHSVYTTLEVVPPASVNFGAAYVGASKVKLPNSRALYASVDVIGMLSGSTANFGAGIASGARNLNGMLVASGTLSCDSCQIRGNGFGIGALTVPLPTSSPFSGVPSITLTHSRGDSTIGAQVADILTDGSANVNVSGETFARQGCAYTDSFAPVVPSTIRGGIDFGYGVAGSTGGNDFIGARTTEILVTRRNETVSALDDTWNPNQQRANRNGKYARKIPFGSGATGKNVTIVHSAVGSTVTVGPAPAPTPTPSTTPSGSPNPTSTPT